MFAVIGVLAVIMVIGFFIMMVGMDIFEGALKLILGIVGLIILVFALRGCMMGQGINNCNYIFYNGNNTKKKYIIGYTSFCYK